MDKTLQKMFERNPIQNIASIGFFENYPVEEYFCEGNSALVLGKSDQLWMHLIGSIREEVLLLLEKYYNKTKYFYSVKKWMVPLILRFGKADWQMETNRYILHKNPELPTLQENFIPLSKENTAFMYSHSDYKKFTSIEYINDRLEKDISAGIMRDGKLVAWGLTHDDGALGFLHVMPKYRRKGLGEKILTNLIRQKMMAGKSIFCNIVPNNGASIKLVQKLGFEIDRKVYWLKLK